MRDVGRRELLGFAAAGAAGLLLPRIARPRPKVFDMGRDIGRHVPRVFAPRYLRPVVVGRNIGRGGDCLLVETEVGFDGPGGEIVWRPADPAVIHLYRGTKLIWHTGGFSEAVPPAPASGYNGPT